MEDFRNFAQLEGNPVMPVFLSQLAPTSATLKNIAPKGSLLVDQSTPALYQNTGTEGVPVWTLVGGGGSTTLAALTDVALTSPSDGQVLAFNNGSSKWINDSRLFGKQPTNATANGGAVTITAADGGATNGNGGAVNITGGDAGGDGYGGGVTLASGIGANGKQSGNVIVKGAQAFGANGGGATLQGGNSDTAAAGAVSVLGGTGTGSDSSGGDVNISAGGKGSGSGVVGNITLTVSNNTGRISLVNLPNSDPHAQYQLYIGAAGALFISAG